MNTRPVFVEKKMLKQHGIRRLFGAGALFFGLFLLVAVVSWVFREDSPLNVNRIYYSSGSSLLSYLEQRGIAADRIATENTYGDGIDIIGRQYQFTIRDEGLNNLSETERQIVVLDSGNSRNAREFMAGLSPSGQKLAVRTGVLTFRTVDIGPDENRRVWRRGGEIWIYTGGNAVIEDLIESFVGEPGADGRETDPPQWFWVLSRSMVMFYYWEDFGYLMVCIVAGALAAVCLFFALRPPKERAPGDLTAFSARMEQEGVTLVAFGKLTGGPYGELPGQERLMAWLVWKGNREYEREVREAERQMGLSFPENLLAVYFFPSHRKAAEASHRIAPAGDRLKDGGVPLGFSYRRRVYRAGKLIAYYAGEERAVYEALEKICGKPFAGIGVRKGTEE